MSRRPPETFHSDLHLARWRRVLIWLGESKVGVFLLAIPLFAFAFVPAYWLKWWWIGGLLVAMVFFALGWNAARRKWLRDGYIGKL